MVLEGIAQKIVENTTEIIGYPITLTNEKGYIIGSIDPNRLGTFHQPSLVLIKKRQTICYEKEEVKYLQNVFPGVATPFYFNNEPIGVLGIVGDPKEVKKYAQLVKSHVEMMCQEAFRKEMNLIESKTIDNLIQYLINPNPSHNTEDIIQFGKMLGYNLNLKRICLLIEIDVLDLPNNHDGLYDKYNFQYFQKELIDNLKHFLIDNNQELISLLTLEQFIILKTVNPEESIDTYLKRLRYNLQRLSKFLKEKHNITASISIGSVNSGIKESYQDAIKSLTVGKTTNIEPKIYYYNDWEITFEMLTNEIQPYITNKLIENLECFFNADNYDTLASTFMAYCKCNLNLSKAARSLFLHRNSMVYRLEKIAELTSLNMSNFEHCLFLYIAIKNFNFKSSKLKTKK